MAGDAFEILGYIARFWLYLISSSFRAETHRQWRDAAGWERPFIVLEFVVSAILGLAVPVLVLWWMAAA